MIDLAAVRRTIENKPSPTAIVAVSRRFLEQVEIELATGRAAQAHLAALQATRDAR
ncbi:MAG TPA: hypothetical protein VNH53_03865 [Sphingomicrobium sp.]|jgi:hypothetical protein|nr:hypothetical protein [Sphingomicrobium sp.]